MSKYSDKLDEFFYGKGKLEKGIYVVGAFAGVIIAGIIGYKALSYVFG